MKPKHMNFSLLDSGQVIYRADICAAADRKHSLIPVGLESCFFWLSYDDCEALIIFIHIKPVSDPQPALYGNCICYWLFLHSLIQVFPLICHLSVSSRLTYDRHSSDTRSAYSTFCFWKSFFPLALPLSRPFAGSPRDKTAPSGWSVARSCLDRAWRLPGSWLLPSVSESVL